MATPIEANQCLVLATQPPRQHWPAKVIWRSGKPDYAENPDGFGSEWQ
jgi:hypothetical protein